jgi:signal transduction histidine kinase
MLAEQRRLEALKDDFVSMVSHELRTPLTSIHGALGLLESKFGAALPEDARRLVDVARRNSQRLARLVDNVLDLQRMQSGALAFDVKELCLQPLLQSAVETNQPYAARLGVRLRLDAVPDVHVVADSDRLIQVVTNLVSNAAKCSPAGETVVVSAERTRTHARVRVTDSGPGIPENFRPRVFERFAQADGSTTRRADGSGLGLSISKAIVERLGGTIGFDTCQTGTTFYFDVPLAAAPAEAPPCNDRR